MLNNVRSSFNIRINEYSNVQTFCESLAILMGTTLLTGIGHILGVQDNSSSCSQKEQVRENSTPLRVHAFYADAFDKVDTRDN